MKVMIMAGGTGGHVFPALAVADYMRSRGASVVWMGTRNGIEARVVPEQGYPVEWISVRGLRRSGWLALLWAPLGLLRAFLQAVRVIRGQRPAVVLGMGGFASGPGGLAAWLLRRPLVIHEQNASPGLTNRLLARLAVLVLEALPGTFPLARRAQAVGNPVRRDIFARCQAPRENRSGPLHLLVLGGSQGALSLNRMVPEALRTMSGARRPAIWHQAGRTLKAAREAYGGKLESLRLDAFIDDMAEAYAWADLVVCRAGALTVAELAAAGLPAILVPYPAAVDDHQSANGRYLEEAGAAVMIRQGELTAEGLGNLLEEFMGDRERVLTMGRAARERAWPEATEQIAESCMAMARGGST